MVRAREAAEHALDAHGKIMGNTMRTQIANMRESRKVSFQHFENAAREMDKARARAEAVIAKIEAETNAPAEPKGVPDAMLRAEIRSALAAMPQDKRSKAVFQAVEDGDDDVVGAALTGPVLLTGLGVAEREAIRDRWRRKRYPDQVERATRLRAALADLDRGGSLLLQFISGLTDGEAIKQAEQAEAAALTASKVSEVA
jgi:hypothetical protein